ncbi:MAG: hypothetical protein GX605_05230 [Chloroflexi bacterium]|nr:hypothetical protein [Chloroflexota bacterium]
MGRWAWGFVVGLAAGAWLVVRYLWASPESPALNLKVQPSAPPREAAPPPGAMVGFCVRCRAKRPMQQVEPATTQRGQPAYRGVCPVCGARMFRMVAKA